MCLPMIIMARPRLDNSEGPATCSTNNSRRQLMGLRFEAFVVVTGGGWGDEGEVDAL